MEKWDWPTIIIISAHPFACRQNPTRPLDRICVRRPLISGFVSASAPMGPLAARTKNGRVDVGSGPLVGPQMVLLGLLRNVVVVVVEQNFAPAPLLLLFSKPPPTATESARQSRLGHLFPARKRHTDRNGI